MENNKIDIGAELERIKKDISDMEEAGMKQIFISFFSGAINEREFLLAARAMIKARGYAAVHEYDGENGELVLIIRRVPVAIAIEWIDAEWELPATSDEYLVRIAYADKPTVLHYDADEQVFFCEIEGETVFYKVTHWAELPEGPSVK